MMLLQWIAIAYVALFAAIGLFVVCYAGALAFAVRKELAAYLMREWKRWRQKEGQS